MSTVCMLVIGSVKALYGRMSQLSALYATLRERHNVPLELVEEAPRRMEKVGDVLLLEHDAFAGPAWEVTYEGSRNYTETWK